MSNWLYLSNPISKHLWTGNILIKMYQYLLYIDNILQSCIWMYPVSMILIQLEIWNSTMSKKMPHFQSAVTIFSCNLSLNFRKRNRLNLWYHIIFITFTADLYTSLMAREGGKMLINHWADLKFEVLKYNLFYSSV